MLVLLLIIFSLFTSPVFAAPNTKITVAPTSLSSTGITFPVQFIITDANVNTSFYYKFYGGIGSSTTQIQTSSSLTYNSDWTSFSIVTTDAGGSAVVDSSAYIRSDISSGSYNMYTRLALIPKGSTWTTYDSSVAIINITAPSPTATPIPTSTPTPTATPTPDPTITNPNSGIKFTEFMPYSDPEWLEFYNSNNYPVKLVSWKMEDKDGHTRNIGDNGVLSIGATSYVVFGYSVFFDNTNNETVIIRDQNNSIIAQTSYNAGLRTLDRSWSLIKSNYCQSNITKGYENVTSCTDPTLTQTPIPTSTPSITSTPTINPIEETPSIEPTPITTDTPTPSTSSGLVLGDSSLPVKRNFLPIVLIFGGAILLLSPLIISKLKK